MSIETSIKGIIGFSKENEDLIKEIYIAGKSAVGALESLGDKVEANKKKTEDLINKIEKKTPFSVSSSNNVKVNQRKFIDKIRGVNKEIKEFSDFPDILASLYAQRGALYLGLSNTYNDLIGQIITFSQVEIDDLKILMRRATLDTEAKQRRADILDAAVQISKATLKIATKLVV